MSNQNIFIVGEKSFKYLAENVFPDIGRREKQSNYPVDDIELERNEVVGFMFSKNIVTQL